MPHDVDVAGAQRLARDGAQVVEVLAQAEYEQEHLPGAISIPLARLARDAPSRLRRDRPVLVYCYDAECDLSPRAAARLALLGFPDVYDLTTGKVGWLAAGLPTEGRKAGTPRIGALARTDVPTCAPDIRLADIRLDDEDACMVLDADRVVLGVVPRDRLDRDGTAADAMIQAPSTFRPHVEVAEMIHYLHEHDLSRVVVTRSDGTLIGVASIDALREAAAADGTARTSSTTPARVR